MNQEQIDKFYEDDLKKKKHKKVKATKTKLAHKIFTNFNYKKEKTNESKDSYCK